MRRYAKYISIAAVVVVLGLFALVDLGISKLYTVTAQLPEDGTFYADGRTVIEIPVTVTKGGKPLAGQVIYAVSMRGGSFKSARIITDENGRAVFSYVPIYITKFVKLRDAELVFYNESNSVFVSVPAKTTCIVPLLAPSHVSEGDLTTDDIFGEDDE